MHRFIDTLDLYPETINLIVEISPSNRWCHMFHQMKTAGFSAYAIENYYSRMWYLKQRHHPAPPKRIDILPDQQTDVLFTRQAMFKNFILS
jgi:hypothetical protein